MSWQVVETAVFLGGAAVGPTLSRFFVTTDGTEMSDRVVDSLAGRIRERDSVTAVDSLHGGDRADRRSSMAVPHGRVRSNRTNP